MRKVRKLYKRSDGIILLNVKGVIPSDWDYVLVEVQDSKDGEVVLRLVRVDG